MQLKLYGEQHSAQLQHFKVGQIVYEANSWHNTPARIISKIEHHSQHFWEIHFIEKSVLRKQILPEYRLSFKKNTIT